MKTLKFDAVNIAKLLVIAAFIVGLLLIVKNANVINLL